MTDRPDTLPLDQHLCFALYSASMAVGRLYKPLLDEMGITYPQFLALTALEEAEELTVGGLAQRLALEPSTITPLVKRLETAGMVERRRNAEDERQVHVRLTDAGRAVLGRTPCLAEALLTTSGMEGAQLMGLQASVRAFADRLAAA
jgi:DNA-binding MarR family transcriptional regulator